MLKTKGVQGNVLRVLVEIGGETFDEDLKLQAMIEPNIDALNEALSKNPGLFAKWAMLEAKARVQYDAGIGSLNALDAEIKDLEARLFGKYQEFLSTPSGGRGPTIDAVKSRVADDPELVTLYAKRKQLAIGVIEAKASLELLIVGRRTIEQKRDSLLALASNWRQEMERGLAVARRTGVIPPAHSGPTGIMPQRPIRRP